MNEQQRHAILAELAKVKESLWRLEDDLRKAEKWAVLSAAAAGISLLLHAIILAIHVGGAR